MVIFLLLKNDVSYIDSSRGVHPRVGAKIFTVAGPVILYGTAAGAVYGVIYWIIKCITGA